MPDPAVGSAGVSRAQARFLGSDREARGRILAAALAARLDAVEVPRVAGLADDPVRATRLAHDLVSEGLVVAEPDGSLVAP